MKICSKCKEPLDLECFSKSPKTTDGRRGYCKICAAMYKLIWNHRNKDYVHEYNVDYVEQNQEREDARHFLYNQENREVMNAKSRIKHQENREINLLKMQDRYYSKRESEILRVLKWQKKNPEKVRASLQRKATKRSLAKGEYTYQEWVWRCEYFGYRCRYCNIQLTELTVELEHMIPLARGGTNWPSNFVPSCRKCNARKHDKTYKEFIVWPRRLVA